MRTIFPTATPRYVRLCTSGLLAAASLVLYAPTSQAQALAAATPGDSRPARSLDTLNVLSTPSADAVVASALPDAPGEPSASSSSTTVGDTEPSLADPLAPEKTPMPGQPGSPLPRHVSPTELVIAAGQIAPPQNAGDKVLSALRTSVSPFSFIGEVIAASYSQVADSTPHYGQNGTGYAQRLGAAVARGTSQSIFSTGVLAPVLHEDPRYYQLGRTHKTLNRGVYAITRPLITRTDDGRRTPNLALLGGYFGAAALTPVYYPRGDQDFGRVLTTFGTSIGGSALGNLVHEFLPQVLQAVHLR